MNKNLNKEKKLKNKIYNEKKVVDFKDLISSTTNEYKDNIAFTIKDSSKNLHDISFNQFYSDIKSLGTSFINLGLDSKKVALISAPRYEWCTTYFSIVTSNNIAVPLDHLLPDNELENLIIESQVEAIIFDKKHLSFMEQLNKSNKSSLKYLICMDFDKDQDETLSYKNLITNGNKLLEKGDKRYDNIKMDKDKLSILLYTSGTTSKPKAVMLSQNNICSNLTAMSTLIKGYPSDSILVFLPLHHTLACLASFLFCYHHGFKICFADSIKDVGKNMKEYKVSGLVCVPALLNIMYRQIIKGIKKQKKYTMFKILCGISNFLMFFHIDLRRKFFKEVLDNLGGNLRIIIYGSASTDKKIIKLLNTIGIDMIQGYGLTETSPVVSCENDKYHNQIGSTGFPLFNLEVKIDNPNTNGDGEILVKGPNVMLGYYKNEAATNEVIKDGWLYTGDIGHIDNKGYLFITGRKKDVIVLNNGKNVYPEEIEALLNKSSLIEESLVYEKNDKICAKIVYSTEEIKLQNIDKEDIFAKISDEIKKINKSLPVYKYIKDFTLTDIPLIKTTTQKIKRNVEIKKILSEK